MKVLDEDLLDQLSVGDGESGDKAGVNAVNFSIESAPEMLDVDWIVQCLLELITEREDGSRARDASPGPKAVLAFDVSENGVGYNKKNMDYKKINFYQIQKFLQVNNEEQG